MTPWLVTVLFGVLVAPDGGVVGGVPNGGVSHQDVFPIAPGGQLGAWQVKRLARHQEYTRIYASMEGELACVEVSYGRFRASGQWCHAAFCLQACPQGKTVASLLEKVHARLRTWTPPRQEPAGAVTPRQAPPNAPAARRLSSGPLAVLYLALHGLLLLLCLGFLVWWARVRREVRWPMVLSVTAAVVGVGLLWALVRPQDLPTGLITVLHEGRSLGNLRQLYGDGAHAGPGYRLLVLQVAGTEGGALRGIVYLNLTLYVLSASMFLGLACYVLRSVVLGILLTILYAMNMNTWHAAWSETPAMVLSVYFWLGVILAAALQEPLLENAWLRRLALLLLTLLTVLAGLQRTEVAALGIPAVVLGAISVFGGKERLQSWCDACWAAVRRLLVGPVWILVIVSVLCLDLNIVPGIGGWRWGLSGLSPLNLSFLAIPHYLWIYLPAGFIALFVLGMIHGVRNLRSFLLVPISILFLYKTYHSAASSVQLEVLRYLTMLSPAMFFMSLFGYRELQDWWTRANWPKWLRRDILVLLLSSFAIWNVGSFRKTFQRGHPDFPSQMPFWRLARNQQTEVRYLLDLVSRHPRCTFIARTTRSDAARGGPPGTQLVFFGASRNLRMVIPTAGESLDQIARRVAPRSQCVLYYRSLDCHLENVDGCRADTEGRVPIEERTLANLPYSDVGEYGAHSAIIRLGVFAVVRDGVRGLEKGNPSDGSVP